MSGKSTSGSNVEREPGQRNDQAQGGDRASAPAATDGANQSSVGRVRALLASGTTAPEPYADVIRQNPSARSAILTLLHQTLGNSAAQRVVQALASSTNTSETSESDGGQTSASDQQSGLNETAKHAAVGPTFENTGSVFANTSPLPISGTVDPPPRSTSEKRANVDAQQQSTSEPRSALDKAQQKSTVEGPLEDLKRAEASRAVAQQAASAATNSLVPAYLTARDHLDVGAVAEIGGHLIGSFDVTHGASSALAQLRRSLPHQESSHTDAAESLEVARQQEALEQRAGSLDAMILLSDRAISSALTPQMFRGVPVAGQTVTPDIKGSVDEQNARLAGDLHRTLGMLALVEELNATLGDGKTAAPTLIDGARVRVGAWAHRPLDLAFLRAALGPIWTILDAGSGRTTTEKPSDLLSEAAKQAKHTGWLGDIGRFNIDVATNMLRTGGKGMAEMVIADIYTADLETRGYLVTQIKERGLLDALCAAVGWADIKQLHDNLGIGFSDVKHDLQAYFLGKGKYGPSPTSEWENHESSLHSVVGRLGGLGKALNFVLDVATFGFNSSYAEAIDSNTEGITSESESHRAVVHAVARTAAIAIVTTVTGGMVRGGVGARAVAGDAANGAVGAASALGTSDAYNMYIAGTQTEPSAPQRYVEAVLLGGAGGAALGYVARGLSRKAESYLPVTNTEVSEVPVSPYRVSNPNLDGALRDAEINAGTLTEHQRGLIETADRAIANGDIHGSLRSFDQLVESGISKSAVDVLENGLARVHGKTSPATYRNPKAMLPSGAEIPPTAYGGDLFYGTDEISPNVAFENGLPGRGNNTRLLEHIHQAPDTAFRGTTKFIRGQDGEGGAIEWAGEDGWVYKVDGTPSWDANASLEGRVPKPGGMHGDNPMKGEHEHSVLANIPRERIVGAMEVFEKNGRLVQGPLQPNPNYQPLK